MNFLRLSAWTLSCLFVFSACGTPDAKKPARRKTATVFELNAADAGITVAEDASKTVALNVVATNPDAGEITIVIEKQPAHGKLTVKGTKYTYTPDADYNGKDTLQYSGQIGEQKSNTGTLTMTVTPVNDAPTFSAGANQSVNEDTGSNSVIAWATSLDAGPADEVTQNMVFVIAGNTNPALFASAPMVNASGTLSYTPATNATGMATVTVALKDDGGTATGGMDTSTGQSFTVSVNPINDVPSFTKGADPTVGEDAGAQSISNWATALSAGPFDESGQSLVFVISGNTNPTLFSSAPTVSSTGTLSYTSALNATGSATITLAIQDDGGTANGGVDSSAEQTFVITVTPVNDPPTQPGISFFPTTYNAGNDLYVTVTLASTDVELNTVSYAYQWFKDGVDRGFSGSTTSVSNGYLAGGEIWKVIVTPNDGFANGATAWAVKTIPEWFPTNTSDAGVPAARYGHSAVWTGSEMILWGGNVSNTGGTYVNTGGRYNPATDTWTATDTLDADVPSARNNHTAVWTGREMIVWGGYDGGNLNTGGRYDPTTDSWAVMNVLAPVPSARYEHTAVWTGREMIVWGGYGGVYQNTGGRYDPTTDTWTATDILDADVPSARSQHTAVWTGREMIVWGGTDGGHLNTGGRYDPAADSWAATSVTAPVPSARRYHTTVWTGREMIVWGGFNGTGVNTGGRYNPRTDTWTATDTVDVDSPSGRYTHVAVWTGREMIVWGGYDGSSQNTGGRYDPASNSWVATNTAAGLPAARTLPTAVWTGRAMLIWGGSSGTSVLNTGGLYSPPAHTETWAATDTLAVDNPVTRYGHTAVWTGSEMIVWGGTEGSTGLNTGGRYNPATDTWTSISVGAGVPSARRYFTAVWSGRAMLVWGGFDGGGAANTGGRYDPATDTWTATDTADLDLPSARYDHTAVWTGREMIVWGGSPGNLNTGGRYDPLTDTWTATDILNVDVPSGRYYHTTVWTGREMIVWGGIAGGVSANTGGRYDPLTNTWAATSVGAGVPSARRVHTAVWTGSDMIVWGGYDGAVANTGGRYDPRSDSWAATNPVTDVPSARSAHTAVWTGREMIVWGGNGGSNLNTGGRYNPAADVWSITSAGGSPETRRYHTAVWTGAAMIIWGGEEGLPMSSQATGGIYTPPLP